MVHVLVWLWGLTVSSVEVPAFWLKQYRLYLRKNKVEEGGSLTFGSSSEYCCYSTAKGSA